MGNTFGKIFTLTSFGESHGVALGGVIDGCPAGLKLKEADIQKELDRRKPGKNKFSTPRKEDDKVEILSGVFEGKTTGTPIAFLVRNKDHKSSDYDQIKNIFRPGHADFSFEKKYGFRDFRGGGRSSGRETLVRVAGGAIAKKILAKEGINLFAFVSQVGSLKVDNFDKNELENPLRFPDKKLLKKALKYIENIKQESDSVGSMVEIRASGLPVGLGEPVFDKLDAQLSKALFSIGAVKGVEIGAGFDVVEKKGSENNDEFLIKNEKITTKTNNAGGILGGISSGEELVMRCAVKPTPTIGKLQNTVNKDLEEIKLEAKGRHDPIIGPRLVPVAEAMVALVLVDFLFLNKMVVAYD